jgi:hypothetical protein
MKFVMFEGDIYNKDSIVFVGSVSPESPKAEEVIVEIALKEDDAVIKYPFPSVSKSKEAVYNLFRSLNEG